MKKLKVLLAVLCIMSLSGCGEQSDYVLMPSGYNTTEPMEICLPPETAEGTTSMPVEDTPTEVDNPAQTRLDELFSVLNGKSFACDFVMTEQNVATGEVTKGTYAVRYADDLAYVSITDADGFSTEYIKQSEGKTYMLDSLFLEAFQIDVNEMPYAQREQLGLLFRQGTETFVETADLTYNERQLTGDTFKAQGATYTIGYDGGTAVVIKAESSDLRKLVEISNIGICDTTDYFFIPDDYVVSVG